MRNFLSAEPGSKRPSGDGLGTLLFLDLFGLRWRCTAMSKETPKDDPRERTDSGSPKQTDEPWKGNPEKEQRSGTKKSDPDKWQETNTH
jgi:hypothetical protein